MKEKIMLSWSGGKDSALALYELKKSKEYDITSLLTVLTKDYDRSSMHGVRRRLLEIQADALGLSLEEVFISKNSSDEEYKTKMESVLRKAIKEGVSKVVFGDIFLQDVRKYREGNLSKVGMEGLYPVWGRNTRRLAEEFIRLGFKAIITCVDTKVLDKRFAGRLFDKNLLLELPESIDPCGENGEFHSFVYGGPIFLKDVPYRVGQTVLRDNRFYYCDIL